jgi:hypothetical protein
VEKFTVLDREDIAEPLERILPYIQSQNADVETLTFLLALSDRPVETAKFDEKKFLVEEVEKKGITWEEILAEDPFVGEHWEEPEYSGSDEEDWVYETKSPLVPEAPVENGTERKQVDFEDGISRDARELLQRQYWSNRRKYVVLNDSYTPELDFGGMVYFCS